MIASRLFRLSRSESGIYGLSAAYPNYGYMGIPLGILTFGDAAAVPLAVILFVDSILLFGFAAIAVSGRGTGWIGTVPAFCEQWQKIHSDRHHRQPCFLRIGN